MKTAGTFPKAIFFLAAGSITISFVVLMFVRLPPTKMSLHATEETVVATGHVQDETLVDSEAPLIVVDDGVHKTAASSSSVHASAAS
jgi:hypothetical protein